MTTDNRYSRLLLEASRLKVEAIRYALLEPAECWHSIECLHNAALLHWKAAFETENNQSAAFVQNAPEALGLFLDSKDPVRANQVWQVARNHPDASKHPGIRKLKARLGADWTAFTQEFKRFRNGLPRPDSFADARVRDAEQLLSAFPGTSHLWWIKYRAMESARDWPSALDALSRAASLEPDYPRFAAMWFHVASKTLDLNQYRSDGATRLSQWSNESPEVNHMYSLGLLEYARKEIDTHSLRQEALEASIRATSLLGTHDASPRWAALIRSLRDYLMADSEDAIRRVWQELRTAGILTSSDMPSFSEVERSIQRASVAEGSAYKLPFAA